MADGQFTGADGTALAYRTLGQDRASRTLVCHPGGPWMSGAPLGDVGGLGSRDLRVVVLDPRGAGRSARPANGDYSFERYADDLEALRVHLGLDQFDLLAHSHGAFAAQIYAATRPERVSHLVLTHAAARFSPQLREEARAGYGRHHAAPWYDDAIDAQRTRQETGYTDAEQLAALYRREVRLWFAQDGPAYEELLRRMAADVPNLDALAYYLEQIAPSLDTRPLLGAIRSPTLILNGEADWLGPRVSAIELSAIAGSQAMLMPGCGHWAFLEAPGRFCEEVADFLGLG